MRPRLIILSALFLAARLFGPEPAQGAEPQSLQPPWQIDYADGSANQFHFKQDCPETAVHYEYVPVRPEESSTGFYSGGEPRQGTLPAKKAEQLRRWVLQLSSASDLHVQDRAKGTGAFAVKTAEGNWSFIVQNGERLRDFESFLRPLKK